jgi:hypothetical protein
LDVARRVSARVRSEVPTPAPTSHPSRDPLDADAHLLGEFFDFLETKRCSMEPGLTCDRCDICTTRGF